MHQPVRPIRIRVTLQMTMPRRCAEGCTHESPVTLHVATSCKFSGVPALCVGKGSFDVSGVREWPNDNAPAGTSSVLSTSSNGIISRRCGSIQSPTISPASASMADSGVSHALRLEEEREDAEVADPLGWSSWDSAARYGRVSCMRCTDAHTCNQQLSSSRRRCSSLCKRRCCGWVCSPCRLSPCQQVLLRLDAPSCNRRTSTSLSPMLYTESTSRTWRSRGPPSLS